MKVFNYDFKKAMDSIFKKQKEFTYFEIGTATIKTVPFEKVLSSHKYDEYSFILEGEATVESNGEVFKIKKGNCCFIKANEKHCVLSKTSEDFKVIFAFVGQKE